MGKGSEMMYSPFTGLGQLQSEIQSLQSELHRKANTYDLDSLKSDFAREMNNLEIKVGQMEYKIQDLEREKKELEEKVWHLEQRL